MLSGLQATQALHDDGEANIERLSSRRSRTPSQEQLRRAAAFRLALRRFHAVTERVVRSCGLTPRQYLLLLILASSPRQTSTTIGELSEALGLAPSTMTELLDRAQAAGLLERIEAAHDGRVTHVRATAEGRKRLAKAFRELADERRIVAGTALPLLEDAEST
jgi:DNA-binding MarR family transcriptional regulator